MNRALPDKTEFVPDRTPGYPLSPAGRWVTLLLGLGLCGGFLLAVALPPDPRGFGTHQRLGLPECSFRMLFNKPCPGCGMTTSFSHFVRGEWRQAAAANPAGLLMASTCTILTVWCAWSAATGRLWMVDDPWMFGACLVMVWGVPATLICAWRWFT